MSPSGPCHIYYNRSPINSQGAFVPLLVVRGFVSKSHRPSSRESNAYHTRLKVALRPVSASPKPEPGPR